MKGVAIALGALLAVAAPALLLGLPDPPPGPPAPRIRLVPQSSDDRLEDIYISRDSSRLVTHDRGFSPRLWDPRAGRLLSVLSGHEDTIGYVASVADGSQLLTVSESEIRLWDLVYGDTVDQFKTEDYDLAVAELDGTGKRMAIGTWDGVVLVRDVGSESYELLPFGFLKVHDLEFEAQSGALVAVHAGGGVALWERGAQEPKWSVFVSEMPARWVSFSADGSKVLVTTLDNTALTLDSRTGETLWNVPHFVASKGFSPTTLMSAIFVNDGQERVLTAAESGDLEIRDLETGEILRRMTGHDGAIREIRVTEDGKRVATAGDDNTIRFWEVATGEELPYMDQPVVPTAGTFAADGSAFWMGYVDGSIRRHDLPSGDVGREFEGAVGQPLAFQALDDGRFWHDEGWRSTIYRLPDPGQAPVVIDSDGPVAISRDGRRIGFFRNRSGTTSYIVFDGEDGSGLYQYDAYRTGIFSADSQTLLLWDEGREVLLVEPEDGDPIAAWTWPEETEITNVAISPDGQWVASTGHLDDTAIVWNGRTGESLVTVGGVESYVSLVAFSASSQLAFVGDGDVVAVVRLPSGEPVLDLTMGDPEGGVVNAEFSPDDRYLAVAKQEMILVFDLEQPDAEPWVLREAMLPWADAFWSADSTRLLVLRQNLVEEWDVRNRDLVQTLPLEDVANDAGYWRERDVIYTIDATGGLGIWGPKPLVSTTAGNKLGAFVTKNDESWLVLDGDGRYDASNPNDVTGAAYVYRFEGGLEPIDVPQLKAQFYEPGLLGKLVGSDRSPRRPVPELQQLRLYPDLTVTPGKSALRVNVGLKERDGGGLGQVLVYLNGKEVLRRPGAGYFTLDLAAYERFLLPETFLPEGRGNELQVVATNDAGDLRGRPVTLDVGVPENLRAPDVTLFGLFVGAGDYVGSYGDLQAPPDDAVAMESALRQAAGRLLGSRVKMTLLTTRPGHERPTRRAILDWLKQTATQANSTDIVLVFMAGHGVSRLGEVSDYFFLTPDADPAEMNAVVASTAAVSGEELREGLSQIPANKQVVILDTCHSGSAEVALLSTARSVSGDYRRAWEAIRDATGTWLLAGAAADQKSYEAPSVDHGLLTYSLLEPIDRLTEDALRRGEGGDLFLDVERWLSYAVARVDSLKTELRIPGAQQPQFRRNDSDRSFDLGTIDESFRGSVGLVPPKPIVLVGEFDMDKLDPLGLEDSIRAAAGESTKLKLWPEVRKHPGVFRVAGSYEVAEERIVLKLYLQRFDDKAVVSNIEVVELEAQVSELGQLARRVIEQVEARVEQLEAKPVGVGQSSG